MVTMVATRSFFHWLWIAISWIVCIHMVQNTADSFMHGVEIILRSLQTSFKAPSKINCGKPPLMWHKKVQTVAPVATLLMFQLL